MNTNVLFAVFKRNFVSYFANPTGYVFICVFVLLSAFAAFWPNAFFNNNLANLNQLNEVFPFIMLVFIPAITMSIWADERRQGTDELLLTIPAGDFDIVLGKYLAAVAIYSVALGFSLVCNYAVLQTLGDPDGGLLLSTYVGYWLVGLAMLAIGMVASFLTGNITVAYVLGTVFNVPLVFATYADTIVPGRLALAVKDWSIGQQLHDFGRGVISVEGVAYFAMIVAVMLYLSMVLIGRRHWIRGRDWFVLGGHYLLRTAALVIVAAGLTFFLKHHDRRLDVTSERLISLSPSTVELLSKLEPKRPVQIEAFVSPVVPELYVQTRLDLLAKLRELEAYGRGNVRLQLNDTEAYSEEASRAEKRFGITPRQVRTQQRGAVSQEPIFLHVAMSSGLQKVAPVFFDRGVPVEYELVRSLCTVAQQKRKRVGILKTDAQLYGQFNMQTMSPGSNWPIIDELEKQYDLVQVDPHQPITEKYDALLAVQPSSLGPEEMDNFLAAVRNGQPTAIFEDPAPMFEPGVPATSAPRMPPGGMNNMFMMRQQQPLPKGDIGKLWRLLGVDFADDKIIYQNYNPYPNTAQVFPPEFVFVDKGAGASQKGSFEPFSDDPATKGLQHVLFPFPGAVSKLHASQLEFKVLARTGQRTGTVRFGDLMQFGPFGPRGGLNPARRHEPTFESYSLAAHIRGKVKPDAMLVGEEGKTNQAKDEPKPDPKPEEKVDAQPEAKDEIKTEPEAKTEAKPAAEPEAKSDAKTDAKPEVKPETTPESKADDKTESKPAEKTDAVAEKKPEEKPKETEVNVILVTDIDMLAQDFFRLREQGEIPEAGVNFDFDNVTFVLNVLDELVGDRRFIDIRSRRPKHRTLTRIEELTEEARREAAKQRDRFVKEFDDAQKREQQELDKRIEELKKRKDVDPQQALIEVAMAQQDGQRRIEQATERLRAKKDREVNRIETDLTLQVRRVQDRYKMWAVLLPPIPPLLVGLGVLITRRTREREGIARSRLR